MPTPSLVQPSAHPAALRLFRDYVSARSDVFNLSLDEDLSDTIASSLHRDRVPATAIIDALQQAALQTGRANMGLDFARWASARTFGPLTSTRQGFNSLSDAINAGARYLHLENGGLGLSRSIEGDEVAIIFALSVTPRYGMSQFMESITLLALGMMRDVMGETWSPIRVEFSHAKPDLGRATAHAFRAPVDHAADRNAIIIARSDLHRRAQQQGGDTTIVRSDLESLSRSTPPDFAMRVEQVIAANLAGDAACLATIAESLAITPRTLQRRLKANGLTFSDVTDRARYRTAREYIRTQPAPTLLDLTHRLGFSAPSVTSRYLADTFGMGLRQLARQRECGFASASTMSPYTKAT